MVSSLAHWFLGMCWGLFKHLSVANFPFCALSLCGQRSYCYSIPWKWLRFAWQYRTPSVLLSVRVHLERTWVVQLLGACLSTCRLYPSCYTYGSSVLYLCSFSPPVLSVTERSISTGRTTRMDVPVSSSPVRLCCSGGAISTGVGWGNLPEWPSNCEHGTQFLPSLVLNVSFIILFSSSISWWVTQAPILVMLPWLDGSVWISTVTTPHTAQESTTSPPCWTTVTACFVLHVCDVCTL